MCPRDAETSGGVAPKEGVSVQDNLTTISPLANTLEQLETVIERGLNTFVEVGQALMDIRDGRLYRQGFATFEDYCRERWGMVQQHATRLIRAAETIANLRSEPIGSLLPATESQARPLTQLEPEAQREAWARVVETAPEGRVTAAHVQSVVDEYTDAEIDQACKDHGEEPPARPHVSFNAGNNEWYTPPEYIEAGRLVMGQIDLDPASSEIANQIVKASCYFTTESDGLAREWAGRVWMNPPYAAELIGKFSDKLIEHFTDGDVTEAIVLVNNATETAWFQAMLGQSSAVCFVKRRVKFLNPEGNPVGAPLQGQALLYLGDKPGTFADYFRQFGAILFA